MRPHVPFSHRGEQAIQAFQLAATEDAIPRVDPGDEIAYSSRARLERARGEQLLTPAEPVTVSSGEAVTWELELIRFRRQSRYAAARLREIRPTARRPAASGVPT
jgi:hypothetical protein